MAVDMFLKIEGIKGESQDKSHQNEIDIQSYSWGVSQSGTLAFGGGGGAGKAQFQDLHFTSKVSKASPLLFLGCATGEHIKDATLSVRKAGAQQQDFLIIKLNDVLVSSYQTSGSSGGDIPTEQISLNYSKIEYFYKPQNEDGSLGGEIRAGWDLKLNKKI